MPTTLPSSFASAAAGRDESSSSRLTRPDGSLYGEWPRRPNGATQTFRRTSTATSLTQAQQQREPTPTSANVNAPGATSSAVSNFGATRNGPMLDMRYSKAQLLHLYRDQKLAGDLNSGLADLFVGEAESALANGTPGGRWSRREEQKLDMPIGTEACWDRGGGIEPLGLVELTSAERELFSSTVNSTVKTNATGGREQGQRESTGVRKPSMSQRDNVLGASSPSTTRSTNRRREPSESYPFPRDANISTSGAARGMREDGIMANPALGLLRRRTDLLDSEPDVAVEDQEGETLFGGMIGNTTPYGSAKRRPAGPMSAGLAGPASPWGPAPANTTFSTMGAFGSFALAGTPTSAAPGRSESRFRGLMSKPSMEGESNSIRDNGSFGTQGKFDQSDMRDESAEEATEDEHSTRFTSAALVGEDIDTINTESGFTDRQLSENLQHQGFQEHGQGGPRSQARLSPTFTNPYQSPPQQSTDIQDVDTDDHEMEQFHLPGLGGFQGTTAQTQQPKDLRGVDRTASYDTRYFERTQPSAIQTRGFPGLGGLGGLTALGSPGPWSSNATFGTPTRERGGFPDVFGDQRARTPGEVQTPSFPGPASNNAFGAVGGPGTAGRGSRLGSLFSNSVQDQLRANDSGSYPRDAEILHEDTESYNDESAMPGSAAFGTNPNLPSSSIFGSNAALYRDVDSPARTGRPKFDELFASGESKQGFRGSDQAGANEQATINQQFQHASLHGSAQFQQQGNYNSQPHGIQRMPSLSSTTSNQPPAAQQKTMVMPDRIRWIYRDPQGNTQGPWSGLEMHDWYRAGFFSPELLVKKVEDPDYEPLAQLIRRIGNSREPFLVPQIGIPGPPTTQTGNWPNQNVGTISSTLTPSAQPPFAGSFPSFGTTLTAEQQNALERRKQEEQYLMARQKEHLAQQQMIMKQMQMQNYHNGRQQPLQHQPSAQSLHSQPSFSNIASTGGFHASPPQGANQLNQGVSSGQDPSFRTGLIGSGVDASGTVRNEPNSRAFDRLAADQELLAGTSPDLGPADRYRMDGNDNHEKMVELMLADRARLALEQAEDDNNQVENLDKRVGNERLEQFRNLRRLETEPQPESESDNAEEDPEDDESASERDAPVTYKEQNIGLKHQGHNELQHFQKSLSLAEQVQKAASAKQSPLAFAQAKTESSSVETTPPPQSISPLPAPAARRNRSHVADALAAESISQSQSPSLETPTTASLAPWAREPTELQKLPSLKEIQEAEARDAAKQEELAAALRRAQLEKELISQPPPPAPGLPSTSTWASADSVVTGQTSAASAWSKAGAVKGTGAAGVASSKKTMQQIVQEEEALARKKKAAAAGAATSGATIGSVSSTSQSATMGKRYADLASKAASTSTAPTVGGAWTTVGASGKAKLPGGPSTSAPATKPAATIMPASASTTAPQSRPKPTTTPSKTSLAAAQLNAHEEFKKWAIAELRPDLHKDIQVDDFVQNLLSFPPDTDLITEAVHMSSRTVDSRHFAEEFVRRRALAEKGKVAEPSANGGAAASGAGSGSAGGDGKSGSGGWSEVARRGGAAGSTGAAGQGKGEESGAFKIVAAKKKGTRK